MKLFSWLNRIKEDKQAVKTRKLAEQDEQIVSPTRTSVKEDCIPWQFADSTFTSKYVSAMNLHFRNSCSHENFVKCYEACIEEAISQYHFHKDYFSELMIYVTKNLYGRMIRETSSDILREDGREEKLLVDFQAELLLAIYLVCRKYKIPFWKVLRGILEYEAVDIDTSEEDFQATHPRIRLSMQALLFIPLRICSEEEHEDDVLAVEEELEEHFTFFMEEPKYGDIIALREFMDDENYLLTVDFEQKLCDYLDEKNVEDYWWTPEQTEDLLYTFPGLTIEICHFALKNALNIANIRNSVPLNECFEEETYKAWHSFLEDTLQVIADFVRYQCVQFPFFLNEEEWQVLLETIMKSADGQLLTFASSLLTHSLGIEKERVEEFIKKNTYEVLFKLEKANVPKERARWYHYLTFLLSNDTVYHVILKEKPSLID